MLTTTLPSSVGGVLVRGGRRRVPRRGDHDQLGLGGVGVGAGVDGQLPVRPARQDLVPGLHGPVARSRAQHDLVAHGGQACAEGGPGRPGAAEDADAHGRSLAHRRARSYGTSVSWTPSAATRTLRRMGLLDGKRIVITGVLTDASIAFGVAKLAQEEGAEIVLTGAGRGLSLTERTARKLPSRGAGARAGRHRAGPPGARCGRPWPERWDRVDGVLHAIGFAPAVCLGGTFMEATWDDVAVALNVSAYSLKALVDAFGPLMPPGSSLVGPRLRRHRGLAGLRLDGRGQGRARVHRPLPGPRARSPRDPGQPGGRRTPAHDGRQVDPRLRGLRGRLAGPGAARLGHPRPEPAARACVALLSDWFPATTGEMVHVDGGYHAIGA